MGSDDNAGGSLGMNTPGSGYILALGLVLKCTVNERSYCVRWELKGGLCVLLVQISQQIFLQVGVQRLNMLLFS